MHPDTDLAACLSFLQSHQDATWFDLVELGLMSTASLLEPEQILDSPVDPHRHDLVDEFRRAPLGPYSDELRLLLWCLRAQTPNGRYVLWKTEEGRHQVVRLSPGRRPHWESSAPNEFETHEDAEWALFALRWHDHTGQELPLER